MVLPLPFEIYLVCFGAAAFIHGAQTVLAARMLRNLDVTSRIDARGGLAIGFRGIKNVGGYTFFIGGSDYKHSLGQTRPTHKTEIRSTPGTIRPLEWYKVKISLRGSHIRIELDDQMIFDCRDDFSQKGRVKFGANSKFTSSAGRFRNIKVTDPAGKVLLEGLPDLSSK